jgi:amidophosphoribosyltransferase
MWPCQLGIDMPTRRELIGSTNNSEMIRKIVGADTLGYLSPEGLARAVGVPKNDVCMACFTGEFPIPVQLEMDKLALERT